LRQHVAAPDVGKLVKQNMLSAFDGPRIRVAGHQHDGLEEPCHHGRESFGVPFQCHVAPQTKEPRCNVELVAPVSALEVACFVHPASYGNRLLQQSQ
jgi:hypothetical protein